MKLMDYNERKQHGEPSFPMQHYSVDKNYPEYEMPLHWHKEFEIVIVNYGKLNLYLNNVPYQMSQGDIAIIGCGTMHRGEPEECIYECLVFDLNMLRHHKGDNVTPMILPVMNGEIQINCLIHPDDGILYSTVSSLVKVAKQHRKYYEFSVYSLLYRIFGLFYEYELLTHNQTPKKGGHQTEVMTTLLDWIESHYSEQITLKQLSYISGLSEKYLCRLFREYTNRTPIDYINHLRIECAIHEILINHRTVTEAAFECGFNDLGYFSRTFKKHKGTSPKKFISERNSD